MKKTGWKHKAGGKLKPIPAGNKGLSKLPEEVRNKMGFMKDGGEVGDKKISEAISDIFHYATLPPQIDYVKPYKIKHDKAYEYLESLPNGKKYIDRAHRKIDDYYESDASYYDTLFKDGGGVDEGSTEKIDNLISKMQQILSKDKISSYEAYKVLDKMKTVKHFNSKNNLKKILTDSGLSEEYSSKVIDKLFKTKKMAKGGGVDEIKIGDKVKVLYANDHNSEKYNIGDIFEVRHISEVGSDNALYVSEDVKYQFHPSDVKLITKHAEGGGVGQMVTIQYEVELPSKGEYTWPDESKRRTTLRLFKIAENYGVSLEQVRPHVFQGKMPIFIVDKIAKDISKLPISWINTDLMVNGGGIGSIFSKFKSGTKKAYEKSKEYAKGKVHEAKKKNAVEVLNKTYNKVSDKNSKETLDKAREIVVNKYAEGGGVGKIKVGDKVKVLYANDHNSEKYNIGDIFEVRHISEVGSDNALYVSEDIKYQFHPSDVKLITKHADGGGLDDYTKSLGMVKVKFANPKYNYETSVSGSLTEKDARDYFVGKSFNVGTYPSEVFEKVVDIEFSPKGTYGKGGGIDANEENRDMVMNNNVQIMHHAYELKQAVKNAKYIPAWVVAKVYEATTALSNVTHYLDGTTKTKD